MDAFQKYFIEERSQNKEYMLHYLIYISFPVKEIKIVVAAEGWGLEEGMREISGVLKKLYISILI